MEDRKEILAKLYALRAGISVVSQKENEREQIQLGMTAIKQYGGAERASYDEKIRELEKDLDWCEKVQNRPEKDVDYSCLGWLLVRSLLWLLLGVLLGAGIAVSAGYWFVSNWSRGYEYGKSADFAFVLQAVVSSVLVLTGAVLTVFCVVKFVSKLRRAKKNKKRSRANESDRLYKEEKRKEMETITEKIESLKKEAREVESHYNATRAQEKRALKMATRCATGLCYVLEKEYNDLIEVRDWQHLDLVIYYFETGRADTIKEALQQVDRQMQINAITHAIHEAGNQISNTIRTGLGELQVNMVKCFSVISQQLQSLENLQMQQNEELAQIAQKIDFGNALRKKAREDSITIMKDVARIRSLEEYRAMQRRNNM